jgi:hypothetical protein
LWCLSCMCVCFQCWCDDVMMWWFMIDWCKFSPSVLSVVNISCTLVLGRSCPFKQTGAHTFSTVHCTGTCTCSMYLHELALNFMTHPKMADNSIVNWCKMETAFFQNSVFTPTWYYMHRKPAVTQVHFRGERLQYSLRDSPTLLCAPNPDLLHYGVGDSRSEYVLACAFPCCHIY